MWRHVPRLWRRLQKDAGAVRALHCTRQVAAKSVLRKLMTKNKKKFWYESPTLGSQLMYKPPNLDGTLKVLPSKTRREDSIRMRALNIILYRAVTDMLSTPEVSLELYNLQVELTKVLLAPDFSACRLYWKITDNAERNEQMEKVLQKNAPRIRYLLMAQQIVGGVPPVIFVKDKQDFAIAEVEKLLEIADFGTDKDDHSNFSQELESSAALSSPQRPSLFGIDHKELNRQITEYKKGTGVQERKTEGVGLLQQQREQLAELRRHKILKRKMKVAKDAFLNDDKTPQKYLLQKYGGEALEEGDETFSERNLENELQEAVEQLDADNVFDKPR